MLVTFKSRASCPDITMFGDVALKLIALMGRRETIPSAIEPEDIPSALQNLREGVAAEEAAETADVVEEIEEDDYRTVSLHNRALPLIELLETAARNNVSVMWVEGGKGY